MKRNLKVSNIMVRMAMVVMICTGTAAIAAPSSAQAPAPASAEGAETPAASEVAKKKKKTTEVSFEDVLVQGKYHFSDEAVTTVEQDKVLDALLGVRTDFKDRLGKSATRH